MKTKVLAPLARPWAKLALLSFLLASVPVMGQVVNDGATNTLNNVTNTFVGDVTVGTNGSFTLLILTNNTLLTNSGHGYVGRFAGANANTVRLAGANSRWQMSGDAFAGRDGVGNQLVVSNGSAVRNRDGYVGYTSSNNVALVTGAASLWTNEVGLYVGYLGAGNQLVVSNSGVVRSSLGSLGFFSTGNAALVTGAGSLWMNDYDLNVGYNGGGNQLVVSNGGVVQNTDGSVGYGSTSGGNTALVTGTGSRWMNDFDLNVGYNGMGNQLVVSNGGVMCVGRLGHIGRNSTSSNNTLVVTGVGSRWTNEYALNVGRDGGGNKLEVSDGGMVVQFDGSVGYSSTSSSNTALVTGAGSQWTVGGGFRMGYGGPGNQLVVSNGGLMQTAFPYIGADLTSSNNVAVITGAGSRWTRDPTGGFPLLVGYLGLGNQLVMTNGGMVESLGGYLGYSATSSNNAAIATGAGSQWINEGDLIVGNYGAGNQLVVTNGGVVRNSMGCIGSNSISGNNAVVVTGAGSRWTNEAALAVGNYGAGNQLVVTNGGAVFNTSGTVGNNSGANFNLVRVTGAGSLWTNRGNLLIGNNGAFNQLVVSAGGMVRAAGRVTLGVSDTATNNTVLAMGGSLTSVGLTLGNAVSRNNSVTLLSGSSWDVGGGTFIWGNAGTNDTLTIDASSSLTNIGGLTLDENNTAFFLTNTPGGYTLNGFTTNQLQVKPGGLDSVIVGNDGPNVQLTVSNSTLASATGIIGNSASARSNLVLIAGAGSVWSNSSSLFIGNYGAHNQLVVSNGGALRAGGLVTLGNAIGSTNNSVLAVGGSLTSVGLTLGNAVSRNNSVTLLSGSIWDLGGGTFTWGNAGIGDTLTIDASSSLTNIGGLTLDENNTAFVLTNGPGGSAINGMAVRLNPTGFGAVIVGNNGTNVQLTISNTLADTTGTIGNNASALGNSVFVAGAGSLWTNNGALTIGNNGAFNQLLISSTATVSASNVFIGFNSSASNNFLLLSTGALLTNGGNGVLGLNQGANFNSASVSGANSRWQIASNLFVGSNSAFNQLVISNAGSVIAGNGVVVGHNSNAVNNLLLLSTGALLTNVGNSLLGLNPGANSNTASLSGANTRWQMGGNLYAGNSGAFSRLVISNAALAENNYGYVGFNSSSSSNEVLVAGADSRWSSRVDLHVGYAGNGNRLVITNGALVGNTDGYVGFNSISNEVLVAGAGSYWSNRYALNVGYNGGGNRLVISDGGLVDDTFGFIGPLLSGSSNLVFVTGANSCWSNRLDLYVGSGIGNWLVISNGGRVDNRFATIGHNYFNGQNGALVTGANSYWNNRSDLSVGNAGFDNQLVISNGGVVWDDSGFVGHLGSAQNNQAINNEAVVTGTGSFWNHRKELHVGYEGFWNRLMVINGGGVFAGNGVYVGFTSLSSSNLLTISGGSLTVTNLAGSGVLDVRRGTNFLNAGLIEVDRLILTNASAQGGGFFNFNGGTLKTKGTTNSNGQLFTVGNGTSVAAFELAGNGLHTFNNGLAIANNASLRGNCTISGPLTVAVGGTVSPGTSVGRMVLSNSPTLLGNVIMEISRNGGVLTNDQIQVAGPLTYGGSLTVNNLGPGALTAGNIFQLFSASGFGGSFTTLTLPTLSPGLSWANKLLVNGSIEVIGAASPTFATITLSGTNLIFTGSNGMPNAPYAILTSTNVAFPMSNWVSLATNQFGPAGEFSFTNAVVPEIPQRFFRLRSP